MESRLPALEGKYEILGKLHEGGMGAVYKVRHRLLDQVRVVKVMRPHLEGDTTFRERFIREAQAAARLRHRNIAHLYDFNVDDEGTAYIVMEFISGRNLHQIQVPLGQLDVGVAVQLACQSLAAIGQLHKGKLVHRDISPDNLVVTLDPDGEPQVKLIDFGIAKSLDPGKSLTKTGVFIGKIAYASPEHFGGLSGEAKIEPRSDLYSLAVVLYELLTGVSPIVGTGARSILAGHLFYPPRPFSESDPEGRVPEALRKVISKALEKEPDNRYLHARSFSSTLVRVARDEIKASREPDGPWVQLRAGIEMITESQDSQEEPGTQDRLDTLVSPAGEDTRQESEEEIARILTEARVLLDQKQPDQALLKVRQVLGREPNQAEALGLKAEIEKAHAELTARLQALQAQKKARDEIRTLLEQGKVSEAEEMLAGIRSELAAIPAALEELGEEIAERKAIQDREAAAEKGRQAEALLAQQRVDDAHGLLRSARALDPGNEKVAELIARAEAELAARLENEARKLAFGKLLDQIDEALSRDSLGDAERYLQRLEENPGGDREEVAPRARKVNALRDKRRAEAQAQDMMRRLGGLVDEGRFLEAERGLAEAISQYIETDGTPTTDWVTVEDRIHRGRDAMLEEAARLLQAGDLPAAERAVRNARQQGARPDRVQGLEHDIELAVRASSPKAVPAAATATQEPALVATAPSATAPSATAPSASAPSATAPSATAPSATAPMDRPAVKTGQESVPAKRPTARWLWTATAIVLAAAVGFGTGVLQRRLKNPVVDPAPQTQNATADPGLLQLDALPWVEIVAIVDAEDQPVAVPAESYTPLAFELSAGSYTLTLAHPSLAQPQTVEVVLKPGETLPETVNVAQYSADRYFENSW